jgi:hypothetical protein
LLVTCARLIFNGEWNTEEYFIHGAVSGLDDWTDTAGSCSVEQQADHLQISAGEFLGGDSEYPGG